ncbi:MAG: putative homoserine kinase type (protein kinase fold protein) [Thermoleophilia bacterium]|nr:putative homoserine kinase type (protein kinase fold protein) [Thermoleophilia bacterium]
MTGLAYDPALPQRDSLLDPAETGERLTRVLGTEIAGCERARAKYRVGESLRAVFRVQAAGRSWLVAARVFTDGGSIAAYERAAPTAVGTPPLPGVAHDAALGTVFWTFPNDRKLAALPHVHADNRALAALLGSHVAETTLAAYAPEKAATFRCADGQGSAIAYAKLYADDAGARSLLVHESLTASLDPADRRLRLPRALAYAAPERLLLVEPVDGRRADAVDGPERTTMFRRLGAGLARLHGLPAPDGQRFTRLGPERVHTAAALVARARPDLAGRALRLADALTGTHLAPGRDACLHGDAHLKNALLDNGRIALVDLDQVSRGPAAAELGSLLAALRCSRVTRTLSPSLERALAASFLVGYEDVTVLPEPDELRWYTAAALLGERCVRAINRVRTAELRQLGALLDEGLTVVGARHG